MENIGIKARWLNILLLSHYLKVFLRILMAISWPFYFARSFEFMFLLNKTKPLSSLGVCGDIKSKGIDFSFFAGLYRSSCSSNEITS